MPENTFYTFYHYFFQPRLYGLSVGIALCVGILLAEKKASKYGVTEKEFWSVLWWIMGGGVIGARAYHVWSDFALYAGSPTLVLDILKVWNGGLSIIGAVLGGVAGIFLFLLFHKNHTQSQNVHAQKKVIYSFYTYTDLAIFGLPFAQAIGRIGNYFNQELYGLPTSLPWGIFIDHQHRLSGYQQYDKFHPLFLYEMIGMILFGGCVWLWDRQKSWSVGSGFLSWWYVLYYSLFRFWLDFLRIEKTVVEMSLLPSIGTNQVILLLLFCLSAIWLLSRYNSKKP